MMEKDKVQELVLKTIKEFCDQNGIETEGDVALNHRLIGSSGLFDSMDLVNFLVDLEEVLEEEYDQEFILQDERAMSRSHSPFMNPEELTKFILEINEPE